MMQSLAVLTAAASLLLSPGAVARPAPALDYYRLVPGFVGEKENEVGFTIGFQAPNPWGEYTAYLMATNSLGQRTWRIEQYQQIPNTQLLQGSTMYLLEGSRQALLIDTAQPSRNPAATNLKALVRHLLSHENDGTARRQPLDFVVANTHAHDDHIGENRQMADRIVYYMDDDWPRHAPANYIPIREGGGTTRNGGGKAAGEIDLGARVVKAVMVPPHTPGSLAYLDAGNRMLFTGDALGSAWPWLHWANIADYALAMNHVADVTSDFPDIAVLPAHFYQIDAYDRQHGPLGKQYILDQRAAAHGIVDGTIIGEPAFVVGPQAYWGGTGSAKLTYALDKVDGAGAAPAAGYRAVQIPGSSWRKEWVSDPAQAQLFEIQSDLFLIMGAAGEILYLLRGSERALLIGTRPQTEGLASLLARITDGKPLHAASLDGAASLARVSGATDTSMRGGLLVDLGTGRDGRPLQVEVMAAGNGFALLSLADRMLFTTGVEPADAKGRYDLLYTTASDRWFTPPAP
jgi:glyoxylase-like metal-dependent hydrolase (beta-lactamase superfamily II)